MTFQTLLFVCAFEHIYIYVRFFIKVTLFDKKSCTKLYFNLNWVWTANSSQSIARVRKSTTGWLQADRGCRRFFLREICNYLHMEFCLCVHKNKSPLGYHHKGWFLSGDCYDSHSAVMELDMALFAIVFSKCFRSSGSRHFARRSMAYSGISMPLLSSGCFVVDASFFIKHSLLFRRKKE